MIVGSYVSFRAARYLIRDDRIYPFAIAVVLGGLLGARVAHVLDNWNVYASRPLELLAFWNGGIGTAGAPVGSTIAGFFVARRLRLPVGFMFDISVIGILPWCVRYTNPATLGQTDYVHPVAAYDGLIMVVIFIVLVAYWRRVRGRPPESRVYWAYLLLFGGFRFLTSFLRLDPLFIDGLQEAQLLGLIYALAGGIMLPLLSARGRLDSTGPRATTTST